MEKLMSGEVVVVNFPFTDLSGFSKRPALVLANLSGDDTILCQITTQETRFDEYAILLNENNFSYGKLDFSSYIRVNKIFTASRRIVLKKVGTINDKKLKEVKNKLFEILN